VEGLPVMWQMRWEDPALESMFLRLAAANGVLFKRGAYNFVSLAHDEKIITQVERAASTALVELREQQDSF
jgi:glutamate-1-semialdehyde aminotransferase